MNLDLDGCCMCMKHQFLCRNKKCIPEQWTCNGFDDCGDGSDEKFDSCKGKLLLTEFLFHSLR